MSLKMRVRQLERRLRRNLVPALPIPHLVSVWIDSKAEALSPGPIRWGTVPSVPEVFERGPEETENDFVARLGKHAQTIQTPFASLSEITVYAETLKPEPPEVSS